jgi:AbiV family abortive infection protein
MQARKDVEPIIEACLSAAEKFIEAAKAITKPGSYHIAYHLAALALEEVGKASMVFMDAIHPPQKEGGSRSPIEWIEDHERKLFWALWLPSFHHEAHWKTIPVAMNLAGQVHETRLQTLYVDPTNLNAPSEITEEQVNGIIDLADVCVRMERTKSFRELTEQERSDMEWFFAATNDMRLRPLIFSKGSMDK